MLKINNTIYEYVKQKSFIRHISYALFMLPCSLILLIGGIGGVILIPYYGFKENMSIFMGIFFIIISLVFALIGFYWFRSIIKRFTNPVSNYLIKNPEMIVFVKIVGIKTSLSFVPVVGINSYKLILYTTDFKFAYIPIAKNKISEIYKELQRILPHAKFGDTNENMQWYINNYSNHQTANWYQKQILKEA